MSGPGDHVVCRDFIMGSAIFIRRIVIWRYWSLVLVSVSFSIAQLGCATITYRNIRPIKEHRPVVMFNRYLLKLEGGALAGDTTITFSCDVDFVEKVRIESGYDSIPIFIIDSLCFSGECLNSSICHTPFDDGEYDRYVTDARGFPDLVMKSRFPDDLKWSDKYILPVGYSLVDTQIVIVPLACKDKNITVTLFAKLLDRATGNLIAEETLAVKFDIWNRTYFRPDY